MFHLCFANKCRICHVLLRSSAGSPLRPLHLATVLFVQPSCAPTNQSLMSRIPDSACPLLSLPLSHPLSPSPPSVSSVFDFHRHMASDLLHPLLVTHPANKGGLSLRHSEPTFWRPGTFRSGRAHVFTPPFRFTEGFKCHLLLAGANLVRSCFKVLRGSSRVSIIG